MRRLGSLWIELVQTLLRLLPFPCRTGLVRIGNPGRDAPVLLTGNFTLDVFLLIANSRGVNVWCAATGGLLTNHDVVSVLKTSGIDDLVERREVILPQLAATGIEGKVVHQKTGWRVAWGPVRADDIAAFLQRGAATTAMRTVTFPWTARLEMAVAWAFPISLLALVLLPLWPAGVRPVMGLVWAASLVIFMGFPLYERYLHVKGPTKGFVLFDFGERGIPVVLWVAFLVGLVVYTRWMGQDLSWGFVLRWSVASFIVLLILGLDLTGSTPVYKSGLHPARLLEIALDEQRCKGAGFCATVCPKDVFEIDEERRLATLPRVDECVQCGACIVQCPFDALYFRGPTGDVVEPDTVRRFKLNLLGTRTIATTHERGAD